MTISIIGLILFVGLVGVTLLGGWLRRVIPAEQLSADSKDVVKLALGLVGTMTAILLGLLISSAKDSFDTTQSDVMQMAAKVALLDRVLKLYGSEAMDARRALRDTIADAVRQTWPAEGTGPVRLDPNQQMGGALYVEVQRLSPQDDMQRGLKTQATDLMVQLAELRSLLQAQATPRSAMVHLEPHEVLAVLKAAKTSSTRSWARGCSRTVIRNSMRPPPRSTSGSAFA
jgi:hypothetical protein